MNHPIQRPVLWLVLLLAVLVISLASVPMQAAPFRDLHITFTQPDGTQIVVVGTGDEFYAAFETVEGYSVVFDPSLHAYCFAQLTSDGRLDSTGVQVHHRHPSNLGMTKHLRSTPAQREQQIRNRRQVWQQGMENEKRWGERKAALQQVEAQAPAGTQLPGGIESAPPGTTTIGQKTGLTLLIDFDDDPATMPQSEIFNFLNGDNYAGYGNSGSVKQYFQNASGGLLTYSNVVTIYIRIPNSLHHKSYYNNTTNDDGANANLLIQDALTIMKALPNYATDILPTFNNLTVDANNFVVALNVFYAGGNGGVWSYGLWPHSWSLYDVGAQELSPGGKKVYRYQISNIGSTLAIGTFCHENGHMLCGYPDLYDYTGRSFGAGLYCLMAYGAYGPDGSGNHPGLICAYLKRASGWAKTTDLGGSSAVTATVSATAGTNLNRFYRYQKPGVPTEYFLVECRYQASAADFWGSGVLIWHIDELGNNSTVNLNTNSSHDNYEATVMQADNRWDLELDWDDGDGNDLYFEGNPAPLYDNSFSDSTAPSAHWWDGSASGVVFKNFGASAATMSFTIGIPGSTNQAVYVNQSYHGGNPDGSLAAPFPTVTQGYQAAHAGNTIYIFSGSYPESILNMNKPLQLRTVNGTARIGTP